MRAFIYFILVFGIAASSFAQDFIFVKQVWGNVDFVVENKTIPVENLSSFSQKYGVFILKDENSKLFIRIGDKLDLLTFSQDNQKYYLNDLINKKQNSNKQSEESFFSDFFNLFSFSTNEETKINGMLVGEKSGVSRGFNDTNVLPIEELLMIDGYPLKIDFSNFIDNKNKLNSEFNILVKDKSSKKIILNKKINNTFFTINANSENSLGIFWTLEINNSNSSKIIKGEINSFHLDKNKKRLLDELKDKAIAESKTDESTYQIIFIESLRSMHLLANASYYLDLFINNNNNPILLDYKKDN